MPNSWKYTFVFFVLVIITVVMFVLIANTLEKGDYSTTSILEYYDEYNAAP